MTARSAGGRPAGVDGWPGWYPSNGRNLRPRYVQGLEAYRALFSNRWKLYGPVCPDLGRAARPVFR